MGESAYGYNANPLSLWITFYSHREMISTANNLSKFDPDEEYHFRFFGGYNPADFYFSKLGRIKNAIAEIQRSEGEIILFIDEIHNVVGAGSASGALDASNMLKPALARGELQCIGATTLDEYRKYIEKDSALERRFAPVYVDEPSVDEAVEMRPERLLAKISSRTEGNPDDLGARANRLERPRVDCIHALVRDRARDDVDPLNLGVMRERPRLVDDVRHLAARVRIAAELDVGRPYQPVHGQ